MFTFLTRLGHLFIAIPVIVAVTAIMGFSVLSTVPVASRHNNATAASCTLAATVVGAPLTLSGVGYAPGEAYAAKFVWPNGTSGVFGATANSSGGITVSTYAWSSGTFTAYVSTIGGNSRLMTSCSVTVS